MPLKTQSIEVLVVDSSGCRATDRLVIRIDDRRNVYVPNIFSPASSENGVVTVYGGSDVVEIELFEIYDRWGDKLFRVESFAPNDESVGWNGSYRGAQVQPAVYVYYAVVRFIDGERLLFSGDVTVQR